MAANGLPDDKREPEVFGNAKAIELAKELVKADRALAGVHPGFRPSEAKGRYISGTFNPTPTAAGLSRAPHFQASSPVTVRLSEDSGKPFIEDAEPSSPAKACSVRFHSPDGRPLQADIVTRSLDAFPTRTGAEWLETLRALKAGGKAKATYLKEHPFVAAYLAQKLPNPVSYVRVATYWAANAYILVAADGTRTPVRFRFVPTPAAAAEPGPATLDAAAAARVGPDYLEDEVAERIAPGGKGAGFVLVAQIAEPGDPIDDCTKIWPDDRRVVELGTVRLEKYLDQDAPVQERIIYDPWPNVDGLEPSDDPMLYIRNNVYLISGNIRRKELQV